MIGVSFFFNDSAVPITSWTAGVLNGTPMHKDCSTNICENDTRQSETAYPSLSTMFPNTCCLSHRHWRYWLTDRQEGKGKARCVCWTVYSLFFFCEFRWVKPLTWSSGNNTESLLLCFYLLTVNAWNKVMSGTSEVVTTVRVKRKNSVVQLWLCPFSSMYCLRDSSLRKSKDFSSSEVISICIGRSLLFIIWL